MRNIFVFLSGADDKILAQCEELEPTERTKYIGYGTTVAIPAVLGGISLGYAISTFMNNPLIYIPAGIVWFFVILAIDRFMVSTLHKSEIHNKNNFFISLVIRIFLSIILGVVISHPLVLFIFRDEIEKEINEIHRSENISKAEEISGKSSKINENDQKVLLDKTQKRDCKVLLISAEKAGNPEKQQIEIKDKNDISCGWVTGKAGCSDSCLMAIEEKNKLDEEIKALQIKMNNAISLLDRQAVEDGIDAGKPPPTGYLARVRALESMEQKSSHVWWASTMIILAFIVLDALLVIFKGTTPMGAYEHKKDMLLTGFKAMQKGQEQAIKEYARDIYRTTHTSQLETNAKMDEINSITESVNEFIFEQEKQVKFFDKSTKTFTDRIKSEKSQSEKEKIFNTLEELKELFYRANSKGREKLYDFIDKK